MTRGPSSIKYWLGFNLVDGIGSVKVRTLLDHFGDLSGAWHASRLQLQRVGLDKRSLQALLEARETLDLDAEFGRLQAADVDLLTWDRPGYPAYLKEVAQPPPVLYVRGRLTEADQRSLAIVGTRRLTAYGRQVTREITAGLVRQGITIVSGLAKGIDTIAHQTALDLGGRTIAVLGSSVDVIYPAENRAIVDQILQNDQGAILSEYPLGTKPQAKNFPPRNRIVSGMTLGTVIIEGDVKSGAMITARFAVEQDREVFAVPGPIYSPTSRGPNWLIQQGAKLVTSAEEILEELQVETVEAQKSIQLALPESAAEAALYRHLSREAKHIDDICRETGLSAAQVSSTLTVLELKGIAQHVGGMLYALRP